MPTSKLVVVCKYKCRDSWHLLVRHLLLSYLLLADLLPPPCAPAPLRLKIALDYKMNGNWESWGSRGWKHVYYRNFRRTFLVKVAGYLKFELQAIFSWPRAPIWN
jgi:hypothetical protein